MIRPAALLVLAACGDSPVNPGARPTLRADSGGSAVLVIIACPPSESRALAGMELLQLVSNHEELLIARDGGSVRMTINACPFPPETLPIQARRR